MRGLRLNESVIFIVVKRKVNGKHTVPDFRIERVGVNYHVCQALRGYRGWPTKDKNGNLLYVFKNEFTNLEQALSYASELEIKMRTE